MCICTHIHVCIYIYIWRPLFCYFDRNVVIGGSSLTHEETVLTWAFAGQRDL